ncbi:MAG: S-layer homology domain-containing protein [Clostridia bacterium]|nr:S-layer homology domain-containing protein [Clostridia bacterium]
MKKIISVLLSVLLTFPVPAFADGAGEEVVFSFDSGTRCLSVRGELPDLCHKAFTLTVDLREDGEEFSSSNTPDIMFLYVTDENGILKISEYIDKSFVGGRYDVVLTGGGKSCNSYFIFMNENDPETVALIDDINDASTYDELALAADSDDKLQKLGIDAANKFVKEYLSCVIADILQYKTDSGELFTPSSVLDVFSKSLAVNMITNGHTDEAMQNYASYFGITNDEYLKDRENTSSELTSLLEKANFSLSTTKTVYKSSLLTALIKTAQNWSYMQDLVTENAGELGIDLSDYETIRDSSKYKVFSAMYEEREGFDSTDDIVLSFYNNVDAVIYETTAPSSSGSSGGGGGGRGGSSSVSVPVVNAPVVVPPAANDNEQTENAGINFNDIKDHFAEKFILILASDGIINGYEDGSFKPDAKVTRAEFAKIVSLRFAIEDESGAVYDDVASDAWYASYVSALSGIGIVSGYDGKFYPDSIISRQDAALMCKRVADLTGKVLDGKKTFADSSLISPYASEAVACLAGSGVINGDGTNFRPSDGVSRAECSAMICRLFNLKNAIEK